MPWPRSSTRALIAANQLRPAQHNATEARQRFFQLLGSVAAHPSEAVYISHKDLPGRVAMVSEAYLDYVHQLETIASELTADVEEEFSLLGTATAAGDIEEALDTIRERERRGQHQRLST
jgi:hypothetical protein